ncbi:hypothetical protein M501DRAFT_988309 [Patellaria atrata CBS 101060]|uniref:C2H2-type domain-containing protein n=1 Tax=Patellaria atrata CBS 101060 TaxID=1346257 RepID=A0A9P4SFP1_9PEZI|nr:hypothetical protein M501DRAFT_988309 [Patellaria atrata CBS 101060]
MSEPQHLSGRPSAPTAQQQQQQQDTDSPQREKDSRRRPQPKLSKSQGASSKSLKTNSRSRQTQSRDSFGPHNGSSRKDVSTMQRSASSSDLPTEHITYTKTGRISKAKKGLKVHYCTECGKAYTRAEHLRRHQQNHNANPLRCEWPGCRRTFHREDLLVRHMEKHNNDGGINTARGSSVGSQSSVAPSPVSLPSHIPTMTTMDMPVTMAVSASPSALRYTPARFVTPQPIGSFLGPSNNAANKTHCAASANNSYRGPQVSIPSDGSPSFTHVPLSEPWGMSPQYSSSSGYASPHECLPLLGPGVPSYRPRSVSNASMDGPWQLPYTNASRSPQSATSTLPLYWADVDKSTYPSTVNGFSDPGTPPFSSAGYYGIPGPTSGYMPYQQLISKSHEDIDRDEQISLFSDNSLGVSVAFYNVQQFYQNYWTHFHALFPILHQPSFNADEKPPILKAAMMAIGAQYSDDSSERGQARALHDRCMKVLIKRDNEVCPRPRLEDRQAMFLVEAFSHFKGRRATRHLSKRFIDLYGDLAQDREVFNPALLDATASAVSATPENFYALWGTWVEMASKQRLFLACFILESQLTTFLARSKSQTITPGYRFPFPINNSLWDAPPSDWTDQLNLDSSRPRMLSDALDISYGLYDAFQSSLLISHHCVASPQNTGYSDRYTLLSQVIEPQTQLYYHVALLSQATPLRSLLAVCHQSWFPGGKLSQRDFLQARLEVKRWASACYQKGSTSEISKLKQAIFHALQIVRLDISPTDFKARGLGGELCIYIAMLVLWAVTLAGLTNIRASTVNATATSQDPITEFLSVVADSQTSWPTDAASLGQWQRGINAVMAWAKMRVEASWSPDLGGLNSSILRALEDLSRRGWAVEWF